MDENGTTHCEILKKYEQVVAENTTLRFRVQDATTAISQLQHDLETATQARDIEHERAEMLHDIVEEKEEECAQIASAVEEKQEVCTNSFTAERAVQNGCIQSYVREYVHRLSRMLTCCAGCDGTAGGSCNNGDAGRGQSS